MRPVIEIRLGGALHSMRPTFKAYGDIEAKLSLTIRELYSKASVGVLSLYEMGEIVSIGMSEFLSEQEGARGVDAEKTRKMLYEQGTWDEALIISITDYLASLGWTPEQRKKITAEIERQEAEGNRTSA